MDLLNTDVAVLRVFERNVRRTTFGPVPVGDDFRIRFSSELYEVLNNIGVVQCINIQRLCWLGHVVRMEENAPARRVYVAGIYRSRRREGPCIRLKNQIEKALSSIRANDWHRRERSKCAWKDVSRRNPLIGLLYRIK